MIRQVRRTFGIGIFFALLLLGCSGGESGTGAKSGPGGGGDLTGKNVIQGVITGFGSVYVNGVEYNTDTASIYVDDAPAAESSLKVGMVVTLVGTINENGVTGSADIVATKTEVEGMVDQNKIANGVGTLTVMKQTIHVSRDTRFKPGNSGLTTVDSLQTEVHTVRVSGYSNSQGDIYATYISVVDNPTILTTVKLRGLVKNFASTGFGGNFQIGNMLVKFDSTTQFELNLTPQTIMNGINVAVESLNYDGTGPVTATKLKLESLSAQPGSSVLEIEGVVTDDSLVVSDSRFVLNNHVVQFDSATEFMGGNSADITNETGLQVTGQIQQDGSILAQQIEFRIPSSMEITGVVTSVDGATLSIANNVENVLIKVNELTSYEDDTDTTNQYFYFNDLAAGVNVTVKYYTDPTTGEFIATSVEKVL